MDTDIAFDYVRKLEAITEAKKCGQDVEYAVTVLVHYLASGGASGEYVNDIARSLLANPPDEEEGESVVAGLTAETLITSDFLIEAISHWVELVRKEIVGSSQAPFTTLREAQMWIEQGGPQEAEVMREQLIKREEARRRHEGFTMQMRSMPYLGEDGTKRFAQIIGPEPRKWTMPLKREDAARYTELNWLNSETQIMESATGFSQLSLIQFILTGIKPILRRFATGWYLSHFTLPNGKKLRPTRVEIDVRARDLSFQELQGIYTQYRMALQFQRGKTLNEKHLALYQLVSTKGGPPKGKGTVSFWESIKEEWNTKHPRGGYQTWKGVKMAYDRICQNLRNKYFAGGE